MSIERTYHCEAPECLGHATTATPPPHLPHGFIEVRQVHPGDEGVWHFCGWDCVLRFAATVPPAEVIAWDDIDPDEGAGAE